MSRDESFYEEMDRTHDEDKQKTLSFPKLIIFFLLLILIGEVALFTLGRAIRSRPDREFSVKGLATQGLNLISTTENGEVNETIISQGSLCSLLIQGSSREISCSIEPDGIMISGKFSPLLPDNASVILKPIVKDKKINFEIEKAKIGNISIGRFVAYPITSALKTSTLSAVPANQEVVRIDLKPAVMVISTTSKK